MSIALARSVPQVFRAATECRFPRTDHTDPPGCSTSTVRSSSVSRRNCSTVLAGTHGTPIRMTDWRLTLNWMLEAGGR